MALARIKRNDTVKVISGKDAGKEGRVVRVYPDADKVMVEGVNRVTKHKKMSTSRRGSQEGGIQHIEAPIHASNVMPVCPKCDLPTRVGTKVIDGKKTRFCRRETCGAEF